MWAWFVSAFLVDGAQAMQTELDEQLTNNALKIDIALAQWLEIDPEMNAPKDDRSAIVLEEPEGLWCYTQAILNSFTNLAVPTAYYPYGFTQLKVVTKEVDSELIKLALPQIESKIEKLRQSPLGIDHSSILKRLGVTDEEDRSIGTLLGVMMGDILGVPAEGDFEQDIEQKFGTRGLYNFYPGGQMGVEAKGCKFGIYSDDTLMSLALASALAEFEGKLDVASFIPAADDGETEIGKYIANSYAYFMKNNYRGMPPTAVQVLLKVQKEGYTKSGQHPQMPGGSYANGGAMRISPIGIVSRNLAVADLRLVVKESIRATHLHPEAIDGAVLIAHMISAFMKNRVVDIFAEALEVSETDAMKRQLEMMRKIYESHKGSDKYSDKEKADMKKTGLLGSSCRMQIRAIQAVPLVLYAVARWGDNPEQCLINTMAFGGDTDTTGAIVGGLVGARHGTSWIPQRWFEFAENGEYGRDYIIELARKLAKIDLAPSSENQQRLY